MLFLTDNGFLILSVSSIQEGLNEMMWIPVANCLSKLRVIRNSYTPPKKCFFTLWNTFVIYGITPMSSNIALQPFKKFWIHKLISTWMVHMNYWFRVIEQRACFAKFFINLYIYVCYIFAILLVWLLKWYHTVPLTKCLLPTVPRHNVESGLIAVDFVLLGHSSIYLSVCRAILSLWACRVHLKSRRVRSSLFWV